MLTRGFSCSQRRARDGCCIATMPPAARLVWVKPCRSGNAGSTAGEPLIAAVLRQRRERGMSANFGSKIALHSCEDRGRPPSTLIGIKAPLLVNHAIG